MIDRRLQAVILFGTLGVFLYLVNSNIITAEGRIASGTPIYLELAPADPRSLIQGDFMRLDYQIERDAIAAEPDPERRGQVVAIVDENSVAHFDRYYDGGLVRNDEILMNYTTRQQDNNVRIGVDSFFFQEGLADEYNVAEYAETRVTPGGGVLLLDLVGDEFQSLAD